MNHILIVYAQQIEEYKKHFISMLEDFLTQRNYVLTVCTSLKDAYDVSSLNPRIVAILYDWDNFGFDDLHHFSNHNKLLPIFAMTNKHASIDINLSDFDLTLDFLQYDANLAHDDFKRMVLAIDKYQQEILPPFTKALMRYVHELNYAFCTPGHLGGTAFQKSPTSAAFYDFFGKNIFHADLSISIEELGSLLDHSGPQRDAEQFIANIFKSDRSLIVTNGTSTSNKIVGMYSATAGDTVVIDRNCHKSIAHFLMMVDVVPIYLKPTRNTYGILGGIPKSEYSEKAIQDKILEHPEATAWPTYAVITNSTYDGILYKVEHLQNELKVQHLHFDSAWVPYTNFHPIYAEKFGLSLTPKKDQVIFETQSTHKLLAAFSQSSMIHVKGSFDKDILNANYMMHMSTSPFYPLVASCEVSAAMMAGNHGYDLINEAIELALDFRMEVKRLKKQSSDWYFDVWQPTLEKKLSCFPLKPNEKWHGFHHVDEDHLFLDPVKVTVLLPGIKNEELDDWGIPAVIVEKFLASHGVIVEKTGPYSMLFLFSLGITRAKSMSLLAALNKFKQLYDENVPVKIILPQLYQEHPEFYEKMSIQTLAKTIHGLMLKHNLPQVMYHAFDTLPQVIMTPHQAYQKLIRQETQLIPLSQLKDHISAAMILPYPPGIPLVMPGEQITDESQSILDFLLMLDDIGEALPGFATEIHGVVAGEDGTSYVQIIKKA
ncbi:MULTISPECIES: lysine decarboxylase LdcC [Legionella]|uniref:Lysine decarboxylase, constitutive n=1 Tax=Legionella steelei TaxID=947033 RepID=A0A0W0ZJ31_9GAMM|nr:MULTISPECIES: lysine decarboxylase LdcC [Legionella]KTD69121.1 Lysine decarboxylase, constitutive [Legionella steelei]MBN9225771.1 lysine decarboxylase LdcC [Legionella steelei]OJW10619.1 MAG: lysine decarboxylase LdcC [Legionella sp. 39-23]